MIKKKIYILLFLFSKDALHLSKVTANMFIINAVLFAVSTKKFDTRCENPAKVFFLLGFAIFYKRNHPSYGKKHYVKM